MNEEQQRGGDQNQFVMVPLTEEQHPVTPVAKFISELPFFYFTKQKKLLEKDIRYEGVDEYGNPVRWYVSPNRGENFGAPGLDAHTVWGRLIKPSVEMHRMPDGTIPEIIPLGGIRKCLRLIGWWESGREANRFLRGLRQTGQASCTVDFLLPTSKVDEKGQRLFRPIKGTFTRFSIWQIGSKHVSEEEIESGNFNFDFDLDDTIYIQLHKIERDMQRGQDLRYYDNMYEFSAGPSERQWYELMAAKIFGVVKNNGAYCEIRYSWYVKHHHTLTRLFSKTRVAFQMNRVVADHIKSGYLSKVEYRQTTDDQGQPDFIIRYYPGPEAKQSVKRVLAFLNTSTWPLLIERRRGKPKSKKKKREAHADQPSQTESVAIISATPQPVPMIQAEAEPQVDETLLVALTERGITQSAARELLSNLKLGQQIVDQLEWAEHQVRMNPGNYKNPAGFYLHLLRENVTVPANFETSRKRAARLEEEARRREAERLERKYGAFKKAQIDEYIAQHPQQFEEIKNACIKKTIERFGHADPKMAETLARTEAWFEIGKKVNVLSFEEFVMAERVEKAMAAAQLSTPEITGTDLNEPAEQVTATELSTEPVSGTENNQAAGNTAIETEGREELSSLQHQEAAAPEPAIDPIPPQTDAGTDLSASTPNEPPS